MLLETSNSLQFFFPLNFSPSQSDHVGPFFFSVCEGLFGVFFVVVSLVREECFFRFLFFPSISHFFHILSLRSEVFSYMDWNTYLHCVWSYVRCVLAHISWSINRKHTSLQMGKLQNHSGKWLCAFKLK